MEQCNDCTFVGCLLFAGDTNWAAIRCCKSLEGVWRGLCDAALPWNKMNVHSLYN